MGSSSPCRLASRSSFPTTSHTVDTQDEYGVVPDPAPPVNSTPGASICLPQPRLSPALSTSGSSQGYPLGRPRLLEQERLTEHSNTVLSPRPFWVSNRGDLSFIFQCPRTNVTLGVAGERRDATPTIGKIIKRFEPVTNR